MIPLIPCDLDGVNVQAYGFDSATNTLALILSDSPDVRHYAHVDPDVVAGFSASIAAAQNPPAKTFAMPAPIGPDHFLSRFVFGVYDFTTVTGAASADLEALADPTLEP